MCGPSAVDYLRAASNTAGSIGAEIVDQVGNFFRLQKAANGSFGHHDLLHHFGLGDTVNSGLISNLLLNKRGSYIGWADCITGDAIFCAFQSCHARETEQGMLGHDVGGLKRRRSQGIYRCNIDHSSPLLPAPAWTNSLVK